SPYTIFVGQKLQFKPYRQIASKSKKKGAKKSSRQTTSSKVSPNQRLSWRWPMQGKVISTYSKSATGRKGIDIAGKSGQKVGAAATGKVVYSGNGLPRYGNLIIIKHNDSYLSAYAHNKNLLVKEGQHVKAGQKIALLGRTGTQRDQLHFEIRRNGKPVDPMRFLPKR
ncbi:MAG: peptidoglycan DD-metalloendopeptidase family protein, partial [Methylophagaceae bacterium]